MAEEIDLKQEVDEAYTETIERISEMAEFIREVMILKGKVLGIKGELTTSPRAESLVSLVNSIQSDSSGIATQLHQMAEHLEEMQQILGSI